MSDIEKQLRSALGTAGFWLLIKALKSVEIAFDLEDRTLTIYRDNQEPVIIELALIEDYVNNVH